MLRDILAQLDGVIGALGDDGPPPCAGDPRDATVDAMTQAEAVAFAEELCQRCPAQAECYAMAKADPSAVGMWGGVFWRNGAVVPWHKLDYEIPVGPRERAAS